MKDRHLWNHLPLPSQLRTTKQRKGFHTGTFSFLIVSVSSCLTKYRPITIDVIYMVWISLKESNLVCIHLYLPKSMMCSFVDTFTSCMLNLILYLWELVRIFLYSPIQQVEDPYIYLLYNPCIGQEQLIETSSCIILRNPQLQ